MGFEVFERRGYGVPAKRAGMFVSCTSRFLCFNREASKAIDSLRAEHVVFLLDKENHRALLKKSTASNPNSFLVRDRLGSKVISATLLIAHLEMTQGIRYNCHVVEDGLEIWLRGEKV